MVRHQSLLEIGDIQAFLTRTRPRHVYFSAGHYESPGAGTMEAKDWQGSDLVFDLDADHLPSVNPDTDSYAEMLAACKTALYRLLDFIDTDFGFEDVTIVFSGGRGYHVHVRDPEVTQLDREDRREIVEYVRGIDVDLEQVITREVVDGSAGRSSPAEKRLLRTTGGWGRRVHEYLLERIAEVEAMEHTAAVESLTAYDRIGTGKAEAILTAIETNQAAIQRGNIDVHSAFVTLLRAIVEETVAEHQAPIDEPVTTDTHRLIRLPGSLHGGSGLRVLRLDRDQLAAFDPLSDAIPETFRGQDITIEITDLEGLPPIGDTTTGQIELDGNRFTLAEGDGSYPEYLGIFLMARGRAEKERE